ncbi:hypothetical protein SAZ10_00965 [Mesorhizobium sp. BAC0120]|uniref:hypothetical protein n=1 Tax=Mesorhizobium sp. BAC0120 TaxID=3090670 RepID=UPI00298CF92D|nr:hypothetical protein [Mesorhizobium sp. BAC0120]MDW6020326.1 hypothetical protein [Mesorhizobium sp. BAC0120]
MHLVTVSGAWLTSKTVDLQWQLPLIAIAPLLFFADTIKHLPTGFVSSHIKSFHEWVRAEYEQQAWSEVTPDATGADLPAITQSIDC